MNPLFCLACPAAMCSAAVSYLFILSFRRFQSYQLSKDLKTGSIFTKFSRLVELYDYNIT